MDPYSHDNFHHQRYDRHENRNVNSIFMKHVSKKVNNNFIDRCFFT
jgi:hypothetical protein